MTQVANLNAAMNAPAKTNASSKQEKSQELLAEFAGIMNQNAQNFMNPAADYKDRVTEMADDVFSIQGAGKGAQKDYEKLGSTANRNIAQAKNASPDSKAVSQKAEKLADDVKDVVQETMQVSKEDIEQAMEALGLETFDLLQPQNLIALVQRLTGSEDVSALLTNADFQITMQEVTGLIADFQQENGLKPEQFTDLLAQLSGQVDELEETVKKLLNIDEPEQSGEMTDGAAEETGIDQEIIQTAGQQTDPKAPAENVQEKTAVTTAQEITPVSADQEETSNVSGQEEEQPAVLTGENLKAASQTTDQENDLGAQDGKSKQQTFTNAAAQEPEVTGHHTAVFQENTVMANEQLQVAPEASQTESYIDLQHLMDQMEGLARSFASAAGTTVEMQLNPENLGRLVLSVTERHGNVTAQITASNEQVREALQTQMVELRSTLQEQGIKVEAVEVTVATHEFEQNLDGNASANGQMQEQEQRQAAGGQNGRRNLNINNLDELSGLMSEEETLAAQIMRDNGGTVDYTA